MCKFNRLALRFFCRKAPDISTYVFTKQMGNKIDGYNAPTKPNEVFFTPIFRTKFPFPANAQGQLKVQ